MNTIDKLEETLCQISELRTKLSGTLESIKEIWEELDEDFKDEMKSELDLCMWGDEDLDFSDAEDAMENLEYNVADLLESLRDFQDEDEGDD